MSTSSRRLPRFGIAVAIILIAGCATTAPPRDQRDPSDPWEPFNRNVYSFNRGLDRAIMRPVARGYDFVVPDPAQRGVTNFFRNLRSVGVILNSLLQGRFTDSGRAFERFFVNTIFGVGGLFDVASDGGLEPVEADFGQTLAVWGWRESRFLMLPLFGPSTVRDAVGIPPEIYLEIAYRKLASGRLWLVGLNLVQARANVLPLDEQLEQAFDEYLFVRDAWMQRRRFQVLGEEASLPDYDEFLDDDWDDQVPEDSP